MKLKISAKLKYTTVTKTTIILNVLAQNNKRQRISDEKFEVGNVFYTEFKEQSSFNRFANFEIDANQTLTVNYSATVENAYQIIDIKKPKELQLAKLPPQIMEYLNPSRYCQSDKLYKFANNKFGHLTTDFDKALAITNWIYDNVAYVSGSTNSETSAYETITQQEGVCRDFAHLGIALCRALTIPARYFTAYAYLLKPQDFHACFEAYINGKWILFDATKLAPLNGMVKIAHGHDASTIAVANIFGELNFIESFVDCQIAEDNFTPFTYEEGANKAISYS